MKIIITHDVDHYMLSDHCFKDFYLQKHLLRNLGFALSKKLSYNTFKRRMSLFRRKSMSNLSELISYNEKYGAESIFFVGYSNGLNLSYSKEAAVSITKSLLNCGYAVYPHGIAFSNPKKMSEEFETYKSVFPNIDFNVGIRMHYLRHTESTDKYCFKVGYSFVSNIYQEGDPFESNGIIHFPVSMMDVYELSYSEEDSHRALSHSIDKINRACERGQKYFTIIFHDHHYCDAFRQHKEWYEAVIKYASSKFEFTTFVKALDEIKSDV